MPVVRNFGRSGCGSNMLFQQMDPNPHFTKPPHNRFFHNLKHQKKIYIKKKGGIFATTCLWRRALSLSLSSLVFFCVRVRLWHCDCLQGWLVVVLCLLCFFYAFCKCPPKQDALSLWPPFFSISPLPGGCSMTLQAWMDGWMDWLIHSFFNDRSIRHSKIPRQSMKRTALIT